MKKINLWDKNMNRRICFKLIFFVVLFAVLLFTPIRAMENDDCLTCHSSQDLEAETERGKSLKLYVPENELIGSVHEGLSCTDCHKGEKSFEDIPHGDGPLKVDCKGCHDDVYEVFMAKDVHGKALKKNNSRAPHCASCHGGHRILPLTSPDSVMSRQNQPKTCGSCHGSEETNLEVGITKRNLISRYESSVHYEAINVGKTGASCTDCHGHHTILSSASGDSKISRSGLANSCKVCHPNETRAFWSGAHGMALYYGNNDVPNCSTCHGDHDMTSLRTRVGDAKQWAATQVCIWCHSNSRMMARYGLDTTPVDSYMKDFHGLTQRGSLGASATCADCHDPHHSLPAGHPSSRTHITNRGATCGKCHGQVTQTFALSFSHKKALAYSGAKAEQIIKVVYIILILLTVGGMLLHNFIIWMNGVRKKYKKEKHTGVIRRMSGFERTSHFLLIFSFFILVITGFALKYPEAFWVKFLFSIGMTEVVRGFIHRVAASIMIISSFIFMVYTLFFHRGRRVLVEIFPRWRDFPDFFNTMKYYLGIKKERVRYGMFNYAEKFEFWALVWGTLIMVITGLVLWFPKAITSIMPSWVIGVSRVIHFYEALLATLAILIFHFYYTIFLPGEYPMNTSWLTGRLRKEDAEHRFDDEAIQLMHELDKHQEEKVRKDIEEEE